MAWIATKEFKTKTGRPFTIRSPGQEDAAGILEHSRAVMGEGLYTVTSPEELPGIAEEAKWIQDQLDRPSSLIIVAELENKIIGMLNFNVGIRKRIAHSGEFGLAIDREHREAGIGRALLETLLAWAAGHPEVEKVCLKVHANNARAIALYRKLGFVDEGRAIRDLKYGPDQYVDSLLMAKFVK